MRDSIRAPRACGPAIAKGLAISDVEGSHDAFGTMAVDEPAGEVRLADQSAAQDDAISAGVQKRRHGGPIADAAGHLAGHVHGRYDALDDGALTGSAHPGGIEIHEMNPGSALVTPPPCHVDGVVTVVGDGVEVALCQPHDAAVEEVDGRDRPPSGILVARSSVLAYHYATMVGDMTIDPSEWRSPATDDLIDTIVALPDRLAAERFFRDLCTFRELHDLAQRWHVVRLLDAGLPYAATRGSPVRARPPSPASRSGSTMARAAIATPWRGRHGRRTKGRRTRERR